MSYHYWGFGLNISSAIEFPEMAAAEGSPVGDVTIELGRIEYRELDNASRPNPNLQITGTQYVHNIHSVAGIQVVNGKTICVDPYPGIDLKSVRLLILTLGMSALLYQRNAMLLHASAIYREESLFVFCGDKGAGKSTLVNSLQLKGLKVFSDDICVLTRGSNGQVLVSASYPMMKICEDTFEKLNLGALNEERRLRKGFHKFARYFHNDFSKDPKIMKRLFMLSTSDKNTAVTISRVEASKAFKFLARNMYRPVQLLAMKKSDVLFEMLSELVPELQVYEVVRPAAHNSMDELTTLIRSHIDQ